MYDATIYDAGIAYLRNLGAVKHAPQPNADPEPSKVAPFTSIKLTPVQFKLYVSWVLYPILGTAERNQRVGISASTANRLHNRALAEGLIAQHTLASPGRGRGKVIFEPTVKLLELFHVSLSDYPGQGGFFHRWCQQTVKTNLCSAGHAAKIEYEVNGKRSDVGYMTQSGKHIAHEVELSDVGDRNIRRDLSAGFDTVVCLCASQKLFENLSAFKSEKVKIRYITEVL